MKYQKENVIKTLFKIIPHTKKKYLGINLTKEIKDLNAENNEIIIEKIEDDSKKWKDIPRSLTGKS